VTAQQASPQAGQQAGVILTAAAIDKATELLQREDRDDLRLRVAVQPGGCSGLRYQLFFDDRLFHDDLVIRFDSAGAGPDE